MKLKRLFVFLPIIILGLMVGVFLRHYTSGRDANAIPSALLNKPAPNFVLPTLHGEDVASEKLWRRQPVVINFFASWCAPCRLEHPVLKALAAKNNIPVFAIAYRDQKPDTEKFLKELGNPFTMVLFDYKGRVGIDWGLSGVPETFVVDQQGIIRYRFAGMLTEERVQEEILPLLEKLSHD